MNNDKSLNFFQRRKIEKLLQKGLTIDTYNKAPDYVKQDERIQRKLLKRSINRLMWADDYDFVKKMFKEHKEYFDDADIEVFIEYAIESKFNYDFIRELSDEEQIQLLYSENLSKHRILPYMSESAVEKYIFLNKEDENDSFTVSPISDFNLANSNIQFNIIEKNLNELEENNIKDLISHSSDEAQMIFLEKHIDDIVLFINMDCFNSIVVKNFINNHKDLALTHFELIHMLSDENQLWVFEQDNKCFEHLNERVQREILDSNPSIIENCSLEFKSSFFIKKGNIETMKKCFEYDPTLYKYIGYQVTEGINTIKSNENISLSFIRSIDPTFLNDEKLINLFIQSRLLSAKGSLRVGEFSYFRGGGEGEITYGVDIYSMEQIKLIKGLSIEQIIKLMGIDTNYVLPYLNFSPAYIQYHLFNNKDEEYEKLIENSKNLFKSIFPNKEISDYDEIIDLVFNMQKIGKNKIFNSMEVSFTEDFNIPVESLKLLFNKDIINTNSPSLINSYYKSLFTDGDSSKLFKEIIGNTYGERAVKILEKRKELDVFSINSLEIFDSRILDNFSEEFVNDLISYNMRDFSTFLYIVKNEEDLALFKDYYALLTKLMGKSVDVMQKAITEFYYNKSLLNDIKDKNLTEEQINSLFIVIQGKNNKYNINSLDELDNLNDIMITFIKKKLEQIDDKMGYYDQVNGIKSLIFSDILNVDRRNESIIDYSPGVVNIDMIFDFENVKREEFDSEELFVLDTIIKLLHKVGTGKLEDINMLRSLAEELSEDEFVKNPILINSVIRKTMKIQIEEYNSSLINDSILDESVRCVEYEGAKIYILDGVDIFKGGKRIIAHSDINAQGRDFMEHESQASMSTVSAREFTEMGDLIRNKPHFLFCYINPEDILSHSPVDAGVTHNPKIIKSRSYNSVPLSQKLSAMSEVAFYRRTKDHEKRLTPDGRIKPSYICVVREKILDIPPKDLEYAKKYDIPILLIKEQCYKKSGGYSL